MPIRSADCTKRITDIIARRAFQISEARGLTPGHEIEDWKRAESEIVSPICCGWTVANDRIVVSAWFEPFTLCPASQFRVIRAIARHMTFAYDSGLRTQVRPSQRPCASQNEFTISCSAIITAGSKTIGQASERPTKQFFSALCSRRLPRSLSSARARVSLGRSTTSRNCQPA